MVDGAFVEVVVFADLRLDVEPAAFDALCFEVEHQHFASLIGGEVVGNLPF